MEDGVPASTQFRIRPRSYRERTDQDQDCQHAEHYPAARWPPPLAMPRIPGRWKPAARRERSGRRTRLTLRDRRLRNHRTIRTDVSTRRRDELGKLATHPRLLGRVEFGRNRTANPSSQFGRVSISGDRFVQPVGKCGTPTVRRDASNQARHRIVGVRPWRHTRGAIDSEASTIGHCHCMATDWPAALAAGQFQLIDRIGYEQRSLRGCQRCHREQPAEFDTASGWIVRDSFGQFGSRFDRLDSPRGEPLHYFDHRPSRNAKAPARVCDRACAGGRRTVELGLTYRRNQLRLCGFHLTKISRRAEHSVIHPRCTGEVRSDLRIDLANAIRPDAARISPATCRDHPVTQRILAVHAREASGGSPVALARASVRGGP